MRNRDLLVISIASISYVTLIMWIYTQLVDKVITLRAWGAVITIGFFLFTAILANIGE